MPLFAKGTFLGNIEDTLTKTVEGVVKHGINPNAWAQDPERLRALQDTVTVGAAVAAPYAIGGGSYATGLSRIGSAAKAVGSALGAAMASPIGRQVGEVVVENALRPTEPPPPPPPPSPPQNTGLTQDDFDLFLNQLARQQSLMQINAQPGLRYGGVYGRR